MQKGRVLVTSLEYVPGLMVVVNRPRTPKNGQYLMKTTTKHENNKFWVITLKNVSGLKVVVNRPGTPKMRAIAHANSHKTRKQRVSCHISQTWKGSYEACKYV